jgi:uncharacterized paraquat-inducible protein A
MIRLRCPICEKRIVLEDELGDTREFFCPRCETHLRLVQAVTYQAEKVFSALPPKPHAPGRRLFADKAHH